MKGSLSNKLRKALCALFAGALVITSVPTANVVAYAEESIETATLVYDMSQLEVHERWNTTENKENGYKVVFEDAYKQIFYKIPSEVDITKLVKVSIEMDASDMAVKFCATTNLDPGSAVVYRTNEVTLDTLKSALEQANEKNSKTDALTDLQIIGLMSLNGAVEKELGKITFTVEKEAEDPAGPGTPSEDPKEDPKEDEPVYERPVVDAPVIDVPVVEEPTTEEPTVEEPTTEEPTTEEPTTEEPTTEEPTTEEPTTEEPTVDEPTVEEPTVDEPTVEEPTEPEPEKQPVVEEVTGKAITVTAGETAKIKMPCKKAKIESVKYKKLSAKAAKIVKIDKKNNKVKGLKAGKATIKVTVTKKNGDKIVMTTKVTVKAAPKEEKPAAPETPAENNKTEFTYDLSKLEVVTVWSTEVTGSGSTYKLSMSNQYGSQIFYKIPAEVDMSKFKSLTLDTDGSKLCIKLCKSFTEYTEDCVIRTKYDSNVMTSEDADYGSNESLAIKDAGVIGLMNCNEGKLDKTIKKITITLSK